MIEKSTVGILLRLLWRSLLITSILSHAAAAANAAAPTPAPTADFLSFKTEDESNNIEIFKKASPSVVYVTNKALRRNFFSMNVQEIPRGSGTGIIWNKNGLIITNFHVICAAQYLYNEELKDVYYDAFDLNRHFFKVPGLDLPPCHHCGAIHLAFATTRLDDVQVQTGPWAWCLRR